MLGLLLWLVPVGAGVILRLPKAKLMGEAAESPYSIAIKQLVAVAGGIYISLTALCSFLDLEVPKRVWLAGAQVDPIAVLALCLAALQPLVPTGNSGKR
ncbi:MAG: hypothetical protein ACPLPR_03180 [Bacillota bacterium]